MPKFKPRERIREVCVEPESSLYKVSSISELETLPDFRIRKVELIDKLNSILQMDYKEVKTVKKWVDCFQETKPILFNGCSIEFNSLFIHGYNIPDCGSYPSGVIFKDSDGKPIKRELADLIFIYSLYKKGKKVSEKITFNQAKWGKKNVKSTSWKIDKYQLELLSDFPPFEGVKNSIVPSYPEINLQIDSCELGSYGLMTPSRFVYLGAKCLRAIKRARYSVNSKDFDILNNGCSIRKETDKFISDYLIGKVGEEILNPKLKEADNLFHSIINSLKLMESYKNEDTVKQAVDSFLRKYYDGQIPDDIEGSEIEMEQNMGFVQVKVLLD
ncbi:MAG: hypothetical protein K9I95_14540 [Flavobacteriaceae bacterium]|nr:hypothetical protein [Flavobacteriaceae bacterium]